MASPRSTDAADTPGQNPPATTVHSPCGSEAA